MKRRWPNCTLLDKSKRCEKTGRVDCPFTEKSAVYSCRFYKSKSVDCGGQMNEDQPRIISSTGTVHIVYDSLYRRSSFHKDYKPLCQRYNGGDSTWQRWPLTDKAVSCRKCLYLSPNSTDRVKELAVRASDLETEFKPAAERCKYFKLESLENAQLFHSLQLRFCLHKRHPRHWSDVALCNMCLCPLKYEK